MTRFFFGATAGIVIVACGGGVTVDDGGGGASSSATSSSTGLSHACPANMPTAASPCSIPPEMACDYGSCCPNVFNCIGGEWSKSAAACPSPCPPNPPQAGSACACEAASCSYVETPDAGTSGASCQNGAWQLN